MQSGVRKRGGKSRMPRPAQPDRSRRTFRGTQVDRSTTGRSTGINLRLDQFTSPVAFTSSSRNWPVRRSGRCRFSGHVAGKPTPHPNCHQFTLTRLPVPFVRLVPIRAIPSGASWGGSRCSCSAPLLRLRAPARRPTLGSVASPTRTASRATLQTLVSVRSPKEPVGPVGPDTSAGFPDSAPTLRCSRFTRGCSANPV